MTSVISQPACDPGLWSLDPKITFLNHGAFGACPNAVLATQQKFRAQLERQPLHFLVRDLEPLLDRTRQALARFVGADAAGLVMVASATAGVNTVLRSLTFKRGDELLVTDHEYNASRNALNFVAERSGATVVMAKVPFPLHAADQITEAVLRHVTARTRLVLLDHVTSQTGLIFPVAEIVRELSARGIETLVDGAHAPGMVSLNLRKLGATYYTGNCHKWLCAPKTAAFLYVRRDRQPDIRPLAISHGANSPRTDRSRFQIEFAWTGTWDPSPALCVADALEYMATLRPGGWPEIMQHNHDLAVAARRLICAALDIPAPCPDEMIGSLATIPMPDAPARPRAKSPLFLDPLQDRLLREFHIEVPLMYWPKKPQRILRIAAQLYNSLPQYERLAGVLRKILSRTRK